MQWEGPICVYRKKSTHMREIEALLEFLESGDRLEATHDRKIFAVGVGTLSGA
jgi:hypothetical protein